MAIKVRVGDPFPSFSLPDQHGQPVSSESIWGKYAVFYFYPKDETSGCTTEAQEFSALAPQFLSRNALVYGISTDTIRSHGQFCDRHRFQLSLLSDAEGTLSKRLGILNPLSGRAKRTTVLVDGSGTIVHLWENVEPRGHAREVFGTLESLQKKTS